MWDLISLKEKSKIEMIEAFYETNSPITINTLSEITNTSNRSVKNYLEELKVTMSEIGGEFISTSEGVNFKIPINIGIDYFQKQLFKKSLGFILLEKIFFDDTLNSDQLVNDLYISPSTLSRLTNTIDDALKPYGLSLKTTPYKVTGEEVLIREFYTEYFIEAYTANEWPFKILSKEMVDNILPSPSEYYDLTSEIMNYSAFRFQFAVGLIRGLKGYSVKNEILSTNYDNMCAEIEEKLDELTFDSIEDKKIYIHELAHIRLCLSNQYLNERLVNDKNLKEQLNEIKQMIGLLTEHFKLPLEEQPQLIIEIDNEISFYVHHSEKIQPKKHLLFSPRDYYIVDLYRRKYSTFYDAAKYYMLIVCNNRELSPTEETLEYLIYLLISNWHNLTKNLFGRYNTTIVKVFSHLSLRHAHNIAESLKSDLPNGVEVRVFEEPILDEETVAKYDFDLLVSTETLKLDIEQPIIYMYKSRNNYQFDYLYKKIRKLANKKDKQTREKFNKTYEFITSKEEISRK